MMAAETGDSSLLSRAAIVKTAVDDALACRFASHPRWQITRFEWRR
jgi:hypothetical protein